MTLTVTISDEQAEALRSKAQSRFMSEEDYAREVLDRDLTSGPALRRHISDIIADNMSDMPDEILTTFPSDAASEHDHYLYGTPKRNS